MSEQSGEKYVLINAYDEMVRTHVREMMANTEMCKCEKCFLDVCALVFSSRYSRFVTTKQGELLAKVPEMSLANRVEMTVCITKALQLVRDFPKH